MSHKHTILYAEDDLDDLFIVQQAFQEYDENTEVIHAENGLVALEYLANLNHDPLPCLIILDINMPVMDGRETLIHLKNSELFKDIPVVLFTTSSSSIDKDFAFKWATDFITKPVQYSDLESLAKKFISRCDDEMKKRA